MASKNVCCSIPTAILSAVTELRPCPTDIGQVQNLIFWRAGNSIASEATALISTTWVTLLTATDSTKAVVTPLIDNPVFEGGEAREFGGGNETRNGKPHIKGGEPTLFSASIHKSSQDVIRTIKGWSCEDLEVLFLCEGNQLFYRQDGDLVKGFPIRSLFVSSLIPGGMINSDTNNLSFYLSPNWSDYGVLSTNSKSFDMLGIGLGLPFGRRGVKHDPVVYLSMPENGQYAYVADNNALDMKNEPFVFCGWVKAENKDANNVFFGKGVVGNVGGRYQVYMNGSTGYIGTYIQGDGSVRVFTSDDDATEKWHFVLAEVYQSGGPNIYYRAYIDNVLRYNSISVGLAGLRFPTMANQYEFYIGAVNDAAGSGVSNSGGVSVSDIRLYRKVLTDTERTNLYKNIDVEGYIARWKCNAYPLVDETGNYNLTGVGLSESNIIGL